MNRIPGYEKYWVDAFGRVFKEVSPRSIGKGYLAVDLIENKTVSTKYVHRIVLETYAGPPTEDKNQAAHQDGNPYNNSIENLKWVSQKENESHKVAHGTLLYGERHHASKLSREQVAELISRRKSGEKADTLAAEFGIHVMSVHRIFRGERRAMEQAESGFIKGGI